MIFVLSGVMDSEVSVIENLRVFFSKYSGAVARHEKIAVDISNVAVYIILGIFLYFKFPSNPDKYYPSIQVGWGFLMVRAYTRKISVPVLILICIGWGFFVEYALVSSIAR